MDGIIAMNCVDAHAVELDELRTLSAVNVLFHKRLFPVL
jgi:hypothetical protein